MPDTDYLPKVGDLFAGAEILAVHAHGEHTRAEGVVLGYLHHKREYVVWTVTESNGPQNGSHTFNSDTALRRYGERVTARLFSFHNSKPPSLTYLAPNTES